MACRRSAVRSRLAPPFSPCEGGDQMDPTVEAKMVEPSGHTALRESAAQRQRRGCPAARVARRRSASIACPQPAVAFTRHTADVRQWPPLSVQRHLKFGRNCPKLVFVGGEMPTVRGNSHARFDSCGTSRFAVRDEFICCRCRGPTVTRQSAGVKKAQGTDLSPWWILGGVVVVGIIVAASSGGNSGTTAGSVGPATGTTSTS